jgi:uncharacterized protein with HEPN domain
MQSTSKKFLFDIRTACDEIAEFVAGKTPDDYYADTLLRRGVERDLEIIGEAVSQLRTSDPDTAALLPNLNQMVGIRHRLIHAYAQVNDDIVWDTARNDIPRLREMVTSLLEAPDPDTSIAS